MIDRGVRRRVTETGPDGATTIVTYGEWCRKLNAGVRAGDRMAIDFLKWETEFYIWKQRSQPDPLPRKHNRVVTGKVTRKTRSGPWPG